jgi:hypothetical protein
MLSLLSTVLLLSFLNVNYQYKLLTVSYVLYHIITCCLCIYFINNWSILAIHCSAEPSFTDNSQGSHKYVSFTLKLVKIILINFNCIFNFPLYLYE